MKQQWWHDAVVYQIYPRSFCDSNNDGIGDIAGIISKLDYLETLGINVIWLSPVYQSPMDDNGYDISDYQAIAAEFGTMQQMKTLIKLAKSKGIRIVMDLVVNHTSDEHPWFIEAKKSKDNPYRDYYIWRDEPSEGGYPNDIDSIFGGPAWQWDSQTEQYYFHLFSKRQPDLNWENPQVQQQVHTMMNWWIEQGIGGFRLDVIDLIGKQVDKKITGNGERLHPLLQQMNKATFGDKDLLTVGETWGANPDIAKLYSHPDRNELSMIFQFEHITLTWGNGDKWQPIDLDFTAFKRVMNKWQIELANDGWNSLFWGNHDLPRAVSKYGDDATYRVESAKMLATALHFLKGTPYIYQGEEIAMTNVKFDSIEQYRDIETTNFYKLRTESGVPAQQMLAALHENSRDNARTPMQWDDSEHSGFTSGQPWIDVNPNYKQINVAAALNDPDSVYYHYQQLIRLRKSHPAIVYGDFTPLFEEHGSIWAYLRSDDKETILVVCNFHNCSAELRLPDSFSVTEQPILIANYRDRVTLDKQLHLRPYESFAVQLKGSQ